MVPQKNSRQILKSVLTLCAIRLILIAMTAGLSVSLSSCNYGRNIHFILPDAYTGRFEVVLDEVNGLDVKFENDRYTYQIPQSGVLKVKSFEPFQQWHEETAAYKSGQEIPRDSDDPNVVALRSLGGSGTRNIEGQNVGPTILGFAVATEAQALKLMDTELTPRQEN